MACHRYGVELICQIFMIIPSVFGFILIPLSTVQMYREWVAEHNHSQVGTVTEQVGITSDEQEVHQHPIPQGQQHIGRLTKDIHHTVFGCSPIYMIGWLLNTTMDNAIELLIADICIDAVTISLAYLLWIIADEKVGSRYFEMTGTIPTLPRRIIDVLLFISIGWVFVNNSIDFMTDRLWPRAFFYFYLSGIFAVGILLLTGLVLGLAIRTGRLPNGGWLWALVISVFFMGAIAIPSQIMDGLNHLHDHDTKFYAELPEHAIPFSIIFMLIQGAMLFAGVIYSWIRSPRDDTYQAL